MKLTKEELETIKHRYEEATPGPWTVANPAFGFRGILDPRGAGYSICGMPANQDYPRADAEFIAEARTDVPSLVLALETAYARIAKLDPGSIASK